MAENKQERLSRLQGRFGDRQTKSTDTPPPAEAVPADKKKRKRRTFYIDEDLISRLDKAYPKFSYEVNPHVLEKADFLELLLEYSLDNLEAVKTRVAAVEQLD